MIFNFNNDISKQRAKDRLDWLISHEKKIEMREIRAKRTVNQNSYLHLLLAFFAIEYGETLEYTKQFIFKQYVNADIFETKHLNKKNGKVRVDWRSSSELNTKEMTDAIDRFKNWSAKTAGIVLPEATDQDYLDYIQNLIEQHQQYL